MLDHPLARTTAANPILLGVIGTGAIARAVHLPLLARSALTRVVAVSDIDTARATRVAATYGARVRSTGELLDDPDVEAVLITTPGDHVFLAEAALQRGKHVFAEKPLAFAVEDAEQLGELAESRNLILQVGYMKAFDPAVAALRDAVDRIGAVRMVQVRVRHPADDPQLSHLRLHLEPALLPPDEDDTETLRAAEARDRDAVTRGVGALPERWHRLYRNVLCGSVIHELSLLRAAGLHLPDIEHARIISWSPPAPPVLTISGSFPELDGAGFEMIWAWLSDFPEYQERLEISGSAGSLDLDVAAPYLLDEVSTLTEMSRDPHTGQVARSTHILGRDGSFQRQLEQFALRVRSTHQQKDVPGAADAAEDVRWLQKLFSEIARSSAFEIEVDGEARDDVS